MLATALSHYFSLWACHLYLYGESGGTIDAVGSWGQAVYIAIPHLGPASCHLIRLQDLIDIEIYL